MEKNDFCKVITTILSMESFFDKSYKLGIDLIDSPLTEYYVLSDTLFENNYGSEGKEILNWWLYERNPGKPTREQIWDSDGTPIEIDSISDLYKYMEKVYKNNC